MPSWLLDLARWNGLAAVLVTLVWAWSRRRRRLARRDVKPANILPPAPTPAVSPRRQRVLIVEDEAASAIALRRLFEQSLPGLDVDVASTSAAAEAAIASGVYTVAVIDLHLYGGGKGGEMLARAAPRATKVILMSGSEPLLEALAEEIDVAWVPKPIDFDVLERLVRAKLRRSEPL